MTLYLVRHGSAGRRDDSDPRDCSRHLDDKGHRQAAAVAAALAEQAIEAVVSSPLPRCVQTVEPLAAALEVEVRIDRRLAEGTPAHDAWCVVEELAHTSVVLCSHGDVIPDLVDLARMRGMRMPDRAGFAKGSVWALRGWDGSRFAEASWDKLR